MINIASYHTFLWYTYRTTNSPEALEVSFQPVGEFHPSLSSCSSNEEVVESAEVETSRRDGEVEGRLRFSGEGRELSGG
jgi:hypothetical protein